MARHFVDFSSDTVGQPPVGWTLYGFSSSELSVVADATARGSKALRSYATSNTRRFASYDAAGSAEDAEVLVRFKCGDDKIVFPAVLREQGDDMASLSAHFVQKSTDILTLRKYVNGAASDTASISDPLENTSEWAYMRFRVSGNTLKVKTWAATETEPMAWDIEATSTSISGAGRVGAFAYYSSRELLIDSIGFGTNGDTAPDAPVSSGETISVSLSGSSGSSGELSVSKRAKVSVSGESSSTCEVDTSKSIAVSLSGDSGSSGSVNVLKSAKVSLEGTSGSTGMIEVHKTASLAVYGTTGSESSVLVGKAARVQLYGQSGSIGMIRIGSLVSFSKAFSAMGREAGTFQVPAHIKSTYQTGVVIS